MLTAFPPLDRHYLGLIGLIHLYFLFFSLPELSPLPFTSERYIAFSVKNPNLLWMKNVVVVCERGTYESGNSPLLDSNQPLQHPGLGPCPEFYQSDWKHWKPGPFQDNLWVLMEALPDIPPGSGSRFICNGGNRFSLSIVSPGAPYHRVEYGFAIKYDTSLGPSRFKCIDEELIQDPDGTAEWIPGIVTE